MQLREDDALPHRADSSEREALRFPPARPPRSPGAPAFAADSPRLSTSRRARRRNARLLLLLGASPFPAERHG